MSIFSRNRFSDEVDRKPRRVRWAALAVLAVVLTLGGWLGYRTLDVKSNLERARDSAQQVKDALLRGDANDAKQRAESAVEYAGKARNAAHSGVWNLAAALPLLGGSFKTGQQITDVVSGLATDIIKPAAEAGVGLSPEQLYTNGRINVQLLRQQEPQLSTLAAAASRLDTQAAAIPQPMFLSPIRTARARLQQQTDDISSLLRNTALAAQVAPAMMGADGPRTYLMAFQTNAEARGTGGLLGGFGILRFDNGKPTVDTLAPNTELKNATAEVDLGPEFKDLYGWTNAFTDFRNSNLSSHFPYAAQIWKSMWERQADTKVDGVIALDPVALSYILGAEGPVTMPDGQVITQENVVELTESSLYVKFPDDQTARKKYLQDIAIKIVEKTTSQIKSPGKFLDALGKAAGERRIAVWSAFPAEESILEETPLAHIIPDDPAPYAEVVINNLAGNKMDYYLTREISYEAEGCNGGMRNSSISVKLANTLTDTKHLPDYVIGASGLAPGLPVNFPPGTMVTSVKVLTTTGARLVGVTSNGVRVQAIDHVERNHPSFEVQVAIPPGQSGELVFQLSEPSAPGVARTPVQPLIDRPTPVVSVPGCSR